MGTFWDPSGLAWSPKAPGKLKTRVLAAGVRACRCSREGPETRSRCWLGTRMGPRGILGVPSRGHTLPGHVASKVGSLTSGPVLPAAEPRHWAASVLPSSEPLLPADTTQGLRAKVLLAQRDGGSPIRPSTGRGSEVSRV